MTSIPFPDELLWLAEINRKLEAALGEADSQILRIDQDYMETKRYMADYRGEIDPHEMFQTELLLKQTDRSGTFAVEMRDKLAKLKDSPYFARIDFRGNDEKESICYYIGRFAFSLEDELLILDWRAPVAGMFYDSEVGPTGYNAPAGRINGELTRKRQFKIRDGAMEYVLESSANVQDEVLQRELSQTSDEKMKSIISTIQREQNAIIRNEKAGTLLIQGVAGSGKTSVALHRIAYLLYRFKNRLNARNVAILSPNKVFGDYISNVIPELGEEPIYALSFADLADIQLERIVGFEKEKDPLETEDEAWKERVRFKSTLDFVMLLNKYIEQLPGAIFKPADYTCGSFTARGQWIRDRFRAYGSYPVKRRLELIAGDIHERFQSENILGRELPRLKEIRKGLVSMLKIRSTLSLYKDFFKKTGAANMFVMPAAKTLEWSDVFPFLYLHAAFEGLKESKMTRHLVVDEMQDYTPIQYAVLNLLFECPKTILGDFGQCLNPNYKHTLEDLQELYDSAAFVELNKSYRSTCEIMNFASRILNTGSLDAVERHGEKPKLLSCGDENQQMKKEIAAFYSSSHASLAIVLKTDRAARSLYDSLCKDCNVNLISPESAAFQNGVSITSIRMAKGLEFDEVLIPRADSRTYCSDHDRSLLYIACTRALHRLTLLHTGEPSRFLAYHIKTKQQPIDS